jgi:hypothetical protein
VTGLWRGTMKFVLIVALLAGGLLFLHAQQTTMRIRPLPPEAVPTGDCSAGDTGFIGIVEKDGSERTTLTDEEIGKWVSKKLKEGYSVMLYPQPNGRIFSVTKCEATQR